MFYPIMNCSKTWYAENLGVDKMYLLYVHRIIKAETRKWKIIVLDKDPTEN